MVGLALEVEAVVRGGGAEDGGRACRRVPRVPRVGGTSRRPDVVPVLVRAVVGVPGEFRGEEDAVDGVVEARANAGACS